MKHLSDSADEFGMVIRKKFLEVIRNFSVCFTETVLILLQAHVVTSWFSKWSDTRVCFIIVHIFNHKFIITCDRKDTYDQLLIFALTITLAQLQNQSIPKSDTIELRKCDYWPGINSFVLQQLYGFNSRKLGNRNMRV